MISAQNSGSAPVKLGVHLTYPSEVPAFESMVGRQAEYYLYYQPITNNFPADQLRPVAQEGRVIMLSLETMDWNYPDAVNQPAWRLRNISAGNQDYYLRRYARQLRDFGYPVMMRPMSEMNGWWTAWSGLANGNSPADFIPAWRHMYDIFQQEGASNVIWVWAPNINMTTADAIWSFDNFYPGDAYVDYVGLCGYNWGSMYPSWSQWKSFEGTFAYSYDVIAARTGKPFVIAETSSPEVGGSKAAWITQAFNILPTRFPRVEVITWFNVIKETDWRVNSSSSSLQAFRAAMLNLGPADLRTNQFAPIGNLDGVYIDGSGQLVANGWAIDPSETGPIDVHIYVNGRGVNSVRAGDYRQDIANAYPGFGGYHGFTSRTPPIADTNEVCAYGINTGPGGNTLLGCKTVYNGWQNYPQSDPPAGRHYWWTWYDNKSASSWVLMSNPQGGSTKSFDLNIAGKSLSLVPFGGPSVSAGGSIAATYGGLVGGPAVATSLTGEKTIVSQRTLWPKGGSSIEEVPGIEDGRLSSHYYWPWYDHRSAGFQNWILINNPHSIDIYYEIRRNGIIRGSGTLSPGQTFTPQLFGERGGPLEVEAWTDTSKSAPAKIVASQRVLSNYGTSFNEAPGIPAEELSSDYLWTWYDNVEGKNWILISNPNGTDVTYEVKIGGATHEYGSLAPGETVTPILPGIRGGPVEVVASNKVIASQRIVWGPSFGETMGYPRDRLSDSYLWTWYDQQSKGMRNWVLIANTSGNPIYYEISIPGIDTSTYPYARGTIAPGAIVNPTFPGHMGGPVKVQTWTDASKRTPAYALASQRVLYNGFFNEVMGVTP